MKKYQLAKSILFVFSFLVLIITQAQVRADGKPNSTLFDKDDILDITLSGSLKELLNDRSSDQSPYRPINVLYMDAQNIEQSLAMEIKTRGHFRKMKENCSYPPLLLHFLPTDPLKASIFNGQDKVKLVMPCQGEEYLVKEWLVYKIYNLFTPLSFSARLVKVKLEDTKKPKIISPFYGILLEEEKQVARRNQLVDITRKVNPTLTDRETFLQMAVFEYFIGNTDWSVQYQQNIKLMARDSIAIPYTIPYDFDHSGFVGAPYAKPAEELEMSNIRERRYRGYCMPDLTMFDKTLAKFNTLKTDIYQLVNNCKLLDAKTIKYSIQFLDDFYTTINNPKIWQKAFAYPCDTNGTGNVVIKGLKVD